MVDANNMQTREIPCEKEQGGRKFFMMLGTYLHTTLKENIFEIPFLNTAFILWRYFKALMPRQTFNSQMEV